MPRRITKLQVEEISTVDKGAGEGTRIVLRKRDPAANFRRIFGVPTLRDELERAANNPALPRFSKDRGVTVDDLTDDDVDEINGDIDERAAGETEGSPSSRHISHLSDLISEGTGVRRTDVLAWLMHTPHRIRLLNRTLGKRFKETRMTRSEELSSIAKQAGGLEAVCKHVIDRAGTSNITQDELVKLFSEAVPRRSGESAAQAFSRAYSANDDEGLLMRKAVQAVKGFSTAGPTREAVAGGTAYDALMAKADELRKREPTLTREQSFAKVFSDFSNRELAARERSENRPVA
jgi:hypothetical protein